MSSDLDRKNNPLRRNRPSAQGSQRAGERPQRLVWDLRDIMAASGAGRNWVYAAMHSGMWGPLIRRGRRLVVQRELVEAWLRGETA